MDQKAFIYMQAEKGLSADSIKCLCKEHFGKQAFSSKTIYKWISMYKLGVPLNEERGKPGPKPDEQLLTRIQELLEEEPFISVRQIAQQLNEAPTTIHRYLTVFLGRQYKVTKWIPHLLTSAQKEERVRLSNSLHTILQRSQRKGWYNIITGDESLFHFSYGQKGAWLLQDDKSPEMDGSKISVRKIMVTVIWGYMVYISLISSQKACHLIVHILLNIY